MDRISSEKEYMAVFMLTLELTLAKRRGVAGNEDELGFSGSQLLQGGLVSHVDWCAVSPCSWSWTSQVRYLCRTSSQAPGAS